MYNLLSVLFWQAISSYLIQTIYFHRFSCYRRYFYDYPYKNIKILLIAIILYMTFIHWKVWFPGMQQIQFIYINTFLISNGKYQLLFLNYNYKFSDFLFFFLHTIHAFLSIFSLKILLKHNYLYFYYIHTMYLIFILQFYY